MTTANHHAPRAQNTEGAQAPRSPLCDLFLHLGGWEQPPLIAVPAHEPLSLADVATLSPVIDVLLEHGGDKDGQVRAALAGWLLNAFGIPPKPIALVLTPAHASDCAQHNEPAVHAAANTCGDSATAAGANAGYGPVPNDQQLEELIAEMPGGKDGYMKTWGYAHLAQAAVRRFGLNDAYAGAREDLQAANGALAHQREVNANQASTITHLMADVQALEKDLECARKVARELGTMLAKHGYTVIYSENGVTTANT